MDCSLIDNPSDADEGEYLKAEIRSKEELARGSMKQVFEVCMIELTSKLCTNDPTSRLGKIQSQAIRCQEVFQAQRFQDKAEDLCRS